MPSKKTPSEASRIKRKTQRIKLKTTTSPTTPVKDEKLVGNVSYNPLVSRDTPETNANKKDVESPDIINPLQKYKVDSEIQRPSVKPLTPPVPTKKIDNLSRKPIPSARANVLKRLTQLIPRTQKKRLKTTTSPTRDTGAVEMTTYNPLVSRDTPKTDTDEKDVKSPDVINPLQKYKVDGQIQRPSVKPLAPPPSTKDLDNLSRKPVPSARANVLKRLTQLIPRTQKKRLKTPTVPSRDTGAIEMSTYNPLVSRDTPKTDTGEKDAESPDVINPLQKYKVDGEIQRPSVKSSTPPVPSARANVLKRLTQLIPRTQKRRLKTPTVPSRDTGAVEMTTYNPLVARKTTSPVEDDLKREPEEVISPLSAHIKDRLGFTESLKSKKQIISEKKMPQNICPNIYTNGLNVNNKYFYPSEFPNLTKTNLVGVSEANVVKKGGKNRHNKSIKKRKYVCN